MGNKRPHGSDFKLNIDEVEKMRDEIREFFYDRGEELLQYILHQIESDDQIEELHDFLFYTKGQRKALPLNPETLKLIALARGVSNDDVKAITEYIVSNVYGWQDDEYIMSNKCLMMKNVNSCKRGEKISDVDKVDMIIDIYKLLFDKNYGKYTILLLSYCTSSLFASKLNADMFTPPCFLQIACTRGSALHQLIDTIVEICDVNAGIPKNCEDEGSCSESCSCASHKFYPTRFIKQDVWDILQNNRDMPLIISGYEDNRNYKELMRSIVNITNSNRHNSLRKKFNVIPLFVCEEFDDEFDNVLSMDLLDFDVSREYLDMLNKYKYLLSAWVFKLVIDYPESLFESIKRHKYMHQHLYFGHINAASNKIEKSNPDLTLTSIRNIGYLHFFFDRLVRIFRISCSAVIDEKITFSKNKKTCSISVNGLIDTFVNRADKSLVDIHKHYLPTPVGSNIKDKEANALARKITKKYKELGVHIRVIPIEVRPDRYIFNVETLQNTKDNEIANHKETVQRRLKEYKTFKVDLSNTQEIKLIVAKDEICDNDLLEAFKHESFNATNLTIPFAVGYDDVGKLHVEDITRFPHLLILGETLSGKSTAIRSLLISIAYKQLTGKVNVIIMDFLNENESDYDIFNDYPFMSCPVIKTVSQGEYIIDKLYEENKKRKENEMPYIVCIIDEFPRLFKGIENDKKRKSIIDMIEDILSTGRHSNIHMILSSQSPSRNEMYIKTNNFPAEMCFHYNRRASINIRGTTAAYKLRKKGEMLFDFASNTNLTLQGAYIDKRTAAEILSKLKDKYECTEYTPFHINFEDINNNKPSSSNEHNITNTDEKRRFKTPDEILPKAIKWALPQKIIANKNLIKKFNIGDPKGNIVLDKMKELGLIERLNGNIGWKVLAQETHSVSKEVMELLERNGYTRQAIQNALNGITESDDDAINDAALQKQDAELISDTATNFEKETQNKNETASVEQPTTQSNTAKINKSKGRRITSKMIKEMKKNYNSATNTENSITPDDISSQSNALNNNDNKNVTIIPLTESNKESMPIPIIKKEKEKPQND